MRDSSSRRSDILVLGFTGLLVVAFLGMAANIPALMFLTTPLMVAVLLHMSVSDAPATEGRRRALTLVHAYNVVSLVFWVVALWGLGSDHTLWGLPISTAVIVYLAWPFYTIISGLMYAATSRLTGIAQLHEQYAT